MHRDGSTVVHDETWAIANEEGGDLSVGLYSKAQVEPLGRFVSAVAHHTRPHVGRVGADALVIDRVHIVPGDLVGVGELPAETEPLTDVLALFQTQDHIAHADAIATVRNFVVIVHVVDMGTQRTPPISELETRCLTCGAVTKIHSSAVR